MTTDKKQNQGLEGSNDENSLNSTFKRRTLLKALIGIPVLGSFAFELNRKFDFDRQKKNQIIKELNLDIIKAPNLGNKSKGTEGKLIRVGLIGFGSRAPALANGLGFMHPDDVQKRKIDGSLKSWQAQEDLNVVIGGICDVFDLHAEKGMQTAKSEFRPRSKSGLNYPVKRYLSYQEMLDDKDIDAVMIATPDHHHAPIAIRAAKAGKHVYCEKSVALHEDDLNELYEIVKSSKIVYQLGHQITQNVIFDRAREVISKDILGKITLVESTTNRNSEDGAWIRHLDSNGKPKPGDERTIDWKQWLGNTPYVPFSIDRYYSWTKWFAYDTGVIGQLFSHEFDAINQLLRIGIPKSVVSSGGIYYWKDNREAPDSLSCVFEYPDRNMTLLYSACLSSSRSRGRIFMGHDASMELGSELSITADGESSRYMKQIKAGLIDPSSPMVSFSLNSEGVDAVSSATEKYYASRGLISTVINGLEVDVTYLHVREWINCIRNGGTPTANIEMAFEEGVTSLMAQKSYIEKRRVEWDPIKRRIV